MSTINKRGEGGVMTWIVTAVIIIITLLVLLAFITGQWNPIKAGFQALGGLWDRL